MFQWAFTRKESSTLQNSTNVITNRDDYKKILQNFLWTIAVTTNCVEIWQFFSYDPPHLIRAFWLTKSYCERFLTNDTRFTIFLNFICSPIHVLFCWKIKFLNRRLVSYSGWRYRQCKDKNFQTEGKNFRQRRERRS